MQVNDTVWTPRFCNVKIKAIFKTEDELREAGYTEPTHLKNDSYVVLGKSVDMYHMQFAAAVKTGD